MIRTYRELRRIKSFEDRYEYLKLNGSVGRETFGMDRYLNQTLYRSNQWRRTRDNIIIRDDSCDLGVPGYDIYSCIIIHHMNPITAEDIENETDIVFDLDNLICTNHRTHMAIHYGDSSLLSKPPIVRYSGDTIPWSKR